PAENSGDAVAAYHDQRSRRRADESISRLRPRHVSRRLLVAHAVRLPQRLALSADQFELSAALSRRLPTAELSELRKLSSVLLSVLVQLSAAAVELPKLSAK